MTFEEVCSAIWSAGIDGHFGLARMLWQESSDDLKNATWNQMVMMALLRIWRHGSAFPSGWEADHDILSFFLRLPETTPAVVVTLDRFIRRNWLHRWVLSRRLAEAEDILMLQSMVSMMPWFDPEDYLQSDEDHEIPADDLALLCTHALWSGVDIRRLDRHNWTAKNHALDGYRRNVEQQAAVMYSWQMPIDLCQYIADWT